MRARRPAGSRILRGLPAVEHAVTMECAGNGRARLHPRPLSQPWLLEAVGTGSWRGVALRDVLDRAGARDEAVEVLFTGLDRGVEGGGGAVVPTQPHARGGAKAGGTARGRGVTA